MELYTYDARIKATPEQIFEVVNDDDRLKEWSPIFAGNIYYTEDKRTKGTKFRTMMKVLNKTYQFRSIITEYEENRFIEVETTLKQGIITSSFRLKPEGKDETRVQVTSRFDAESKRYALVLKGIRPVVRRVLDNQMKKLETITAH
ncbi:SRPBCC family protein [Salinicoccus hispanicus]|uniref:SRPBCC family protein n=1 Tax=Salinicoccus hispanicus TaxID=157225 RepID=A0A6N8U6C6_9STAP|nr:SRPBCC family protein [Salinicoccus hispanicus]MXQ52085.1 SRPBCC family protein [Salinicoccus hispanicus]